MKIDNVEERKLYLQIVTLLTQELVDLSSKELGFKSTVEMFRHLYKLDDEVKRVQFLKKLILTSFVIHIYSIGLEAMQQLSKYLILQSFDRFWMEHLDTMTDLRECISLRNLAQRDPLVEYKNEGFKMFDEMLAKVDIRQADGDVENAEEDIPEERPADAFRMAEQPPEVFQQCSHSPSANLMRP